MKFKDYMHQGFIYGDAEQRGMRVCAISPEGGRADGQACLNRRADIRRVTDSEQLCCELPGTANGQAVRCAYRAIG